MSEIKEILKRIADLIQNSPNLEDRNQILKRLKKALREERLCYHEDIIQHKIRQSSDE